MYCNFISSSPSFTILVWAFSPILRIWHNLHAWDGLSKWGWSTNGILCLPGDSSVFRPRVVSTHSSCFPVCYFDSHRAVVAFGSFVIFVRWHPAVLECVLTIVREHSSIWKWEIESYLRTVGLTSIVSPGPQGDWWGFHAPTNAIPLTSISWYTFRLFPSFFSYSWMDWLVLCTTSQVLGRKLDWPLSDHSILKGDAWNYLELLQAVL